jgi:hypothetical protein
MLLHVVEPPLPVYLSAHGGRARCAGLCPRPRERAIQDVQELTAIVDLNIHDGYAVQRARIVRLSACGGIKGRRVEYDCRLTVHLTAIDDVGLKGALVWVLVV